MADMISEISEILLKLKCYRIFLESDSRVYTIFLYKLSFISLSMLLINVLRMNYASFNDPLTRGHEQSPPNIIHYYLT